MGLCSCRSSKVELNSEKMETASRDSLCARVFSQKNLILKQGGELKCSIEFDSLVMIEVDGRKSILYGGRLSLIQADSSKLKIQSLDSSRMEMTKELRERREQSARIRMSVKSGPPWGPALCLGVLGIFFVTLWRKHRKD